VIEWVIKNKKHGATPNERADYIAGVLSETSYGECAGEEGVVELLADLMHYCRARRISFHQARLKAEWHHRCEESVESAQVHARSAREAVLRGDEETAYDAAMTAAHQANRAIDAGGGRSPCVR
jgi:hypothetical protein